MIGLKRPDGLFKIVGSTAANDVIRRAAVEATANQLGGVPDDLALLAEVASVAKYPSQALPTSDETRQTRTCAIGQSQNINRCFDSTGGDVDDTSKSTLGHAIYSSFE